MKPAPHEHQRSFQIDVTCSHGHDGMRPRLLYRLHWEDNEPWMVDWANDEGKVDRESTAVILRNERFTDWSHRWNRSGRTTQQVEALVSFSIESGAAERARSLAGWRFTCKCGRDVPVRQDKLEAWLLAAANRDTQRTKFEFDIAQYP